MNLAVVEGPRGVAVIAGAHANLLVVLDEAAVAHRAVIADTAATP